MKRRRSIVGTVVGLSAVGVLTAGAPSCNSSPPLVGLAGNCSLNSDCNSPLACVFSHCHTQCHASSDCPTGERCVPAGGVDGGTDGVCQLPAESTCSFGPCAGNQVCGSDFQCRAPCGPTTTCGLGATTCSGSQCLDPHNPVDKIAITSGTPLGGSGDGGEDATADASVDQSSADGSVDSSPDVPYAPLSLDARAPGFTPTNFSLIGLDAGPMGDAGIFTGAPDVTIDSGYGLDIPHFLIAQNDVDQTLANLYVMRSLTVVATQSLDLNGTYPVILLVLTTVDIQGPVTVEAGGYSSGGNPGPGAPPPAGEVTPYMYSSWGGASYCGLGGKGAASQPPNGPPGKTYGNASLSPLRGGSQGTSGSGGAGGGALQIVAGISIVVGTSGSISAGGGGSGGTQGGGSGGAILLEAPSVTIRGGVAANGGAGGPAGGSASPNDQPAAGNEGGGNGSAGASVSGGDGTAFTLPGGSAPYYYGAGGGGAGWIRINTAPGGLNITGTAVVSPTIGGQCASQGTLTP
jgi:hypothetical protein